MNKLKSEDFLISSEDGFLVSVPSEKVRVHTGSYFLTETMQKAKEKKEKSSACPLCGWTLEKAKSTHLMGCGLCYSSLYPAYEETLSKKEQS